MSADQQEVKKYGTLLGVFIPSILTILGAIMYLRFGWVVGNAGIWGTMAIVGLANAITLITALSVSSLATSQRVGVGGAYFLISRSLGISMGGAIGLPLYLSQSISLTLYCYALAEGLSMIFPGAPIQLLAGVFIVAVTVSALKATELVLRSQVFIFILVLLSIVSLLMGVNWDAGLAITSASYAAPDANGFWDVFAVFFPAVTGILTGLSLSGDLEEPEKAIPYGTLGAVVVGMVLYMIIPVALAHYKDVDAMLTNTLIWMEVAAFPILILPGLLAAILSSAIGSILSAPRTLQALADDGILPERVGRLEDGEPKFAMYISGGVALLAVLLGDLNAVATVVTMFFLTTYCMINVVSALESLVRNPSFRPKFHISWVYSLMAAAGCCLVMMLINPLASVSAFLIELGIYIYLSRVTLSSTWGDMRGGLMMAIARWALLAHKKLEEHSRNWRPNLLVFADGVEESLWKVETANDLTVGRGIVTVVRLQQSDLTALPSVEERKETIEQMEAFLQSHDIDAFCELDVVDRKTEGYVSVAQANGIAGMQSNTVMMDWSTDLEIAPLMLAMDSLQKSLVFTRLKGWEHKRERIDVWWSGTYQNGDLMLLLAHLLSLSQNWRTAKIYLKTVVDDGAVFEEREEALRQICQQTRIQAECEVLIRQSSQSLNEVIVSHSRTADLVMLGMSLPDPDPEKTSEFVEWYDTLAAGLDNVFFVRNSSPFKGQLIVDDGEELD